MTRKQLLQAFIVTAVLSVSATAGWAQTDSIFVTGGGTSMRDPRSFDLNYIPFTSQFASGGGGNVGFELPLKKSNMFGFELSYGLSQSNFELTDQNTNPTTTVSYGLRDNRISGDLVVHSPATFRNIRPYAVVGAEYDRYSPTSKAVSLAASVGFGASAPSARLTSEGDGGVNFGGGLDYKVTERWGVRIDVRDHLTSSPTLGLPYGPLSSSQPAYFPVSGRASNIEYSIGIVYHFGGGKAAPAAPAPAPDQTASATQPSPAKDKSSAKKNSSGKEKPSPTPIM